MFKYRIISFPLLLALLSYMVWFPNQGGLLVYLIIAPLMIGTAVYEFGVMLKNHKLVNFPLFAAIFSGVGTGIILLPPRIYLPVILPLFLLLFPLFWIMLLFCFNQENKLVDPEKGVVEYSPEKGRYLSAVVGTFGITLFLGVPLIAAGSWYMIAGPFGFLYLVLTTKAMDTGGYIFGKLTSLRCTGNHKICPAFSPKKSWEGTIGGLLFSVGVSLLFWKFCPIGIDGKSLWKYVFSGAVLGLGSFAGDLTESAVKRICKVKDSNHIIPGMGGAFDVLDSFIYNGILFFPLYPLL